MTIEFECVCGETLEAADEYAGKPGICPICQRAILIPEITSPPMTSTDSQEIGEKPEQGKRREETLSEKGEPLQDQRAMEQDPEGPETESQGQEKGGFWSPTLLGLAGAVVFLIVAILVFTLVKQEVEAPEEVAMFEAVTSPAEKNENTLVPPVRADLKAETNQVQERSAAGGYATKEESTETVVKEAARIDEKETREEVAQLKQQTEREFVGFEETAESFEKLASRVGSYTINVASFKEKEGADQLVNELKKKGFGAFRWEVDLPEKGRWHRVSIGNFQTREDAKHFVTEKKLRDDFETFITQIPDSS